MVLLDRRRERSESAAATVERSDLVLGSGHSDGAHRWRPGERLEQLFEAQCRRMPPDDLAVDTPGESLTYSELDARANRLARYLLAHGIGPGGRVALLFDEAVHAYVAMLAVLKAGAAYVPLDPGFPTDRVEFIVDDAGVGAVLSLRHLCRDLGEVAVPVLCLDEAAGEVAALDGGDLRRNSGDQPRSGGSGR